MCVAFGGFAAQKSYAASCSSTAVIHFGDPPSSGTISPATDVDCYTFTGAASDRVRIRIAETSGTLGALMTLLRPNSSLGCSQSKALETNCTLDAAGTWTIQVQDTAGTHTGNYHIAIQRLNSPVGCT